MTEREIFLAAIERPEAERAAYERAEAEKRARGNRHQRRRAEALQEGDLLVDPGKIGGELGHVAIPATCHPERSEGSLSSQDERSLAALGMTAGAYRQFDSRREGFFDFTHLAVAQQADLEALQQEMELGGFLKLFDRG